MSNLSLILLAAGSSSRFELPVKKQWLRVEDKPLWQFVASKCEETKHFSKIIITTAQDELEYMKNYADYVYIQGGATRQESLKNALREVETEYVLVSDIARSCISERFLNTIISHMGESDCIVPYLSVTDTIVYGDETIDRAKVKRVQTPQLSRTSILRNALLKDGDFTDESSAIVANGGERKFIEGEEDAHKITNIADLKKLTCLAPPSSDILSGVGFDVHAFDDKGEMFLCGVKIASDFGFKAHSDGDVAIHALVDALLGAAGMGDIGMMFPDSDALYKGIDSKELLKMVVAKLYNFGFIIVNVDVTIACEKPKINSYKLQMRRVLAAILKIEGSRVNIKATTTEKLGFIGRGEGVGVIANANLKYFDWMKI